MWPMRIAKNVKKKLLAQKKSCCCEAELFWNRLKTFDIAPTIREIQERIDILRQIELQRTLKKLGPLSLEQTEALESLTTSLTNKLTQSSFAELRQFAESAGWIRKNRTDP